MSLFGGSKGSVFGVLDKVTDTVILSLIFLAFCIPVVTIGASCTALYYTANKTWRHNRGYMLREFTGAFKRNFRPATLAWLLLLLVGAILGGDLFYVLRVMPSSSLSAFLNLFFILLSALVLIWAAYLFPYIARFEDTLRVTLKNCVLLSFLHFPSSLLLFLIIAGGAVVMWLFFPLAIIVPGAVAIWQGDILEGVFRQYMSEEDREKEDSLNL